jgi:hypothetical protein
MTLRLRGMFSLLIGFALLSQNGPAIAQTSSEINALLRKSKFVDTGREVNTSIGKDVTTISTFSHPQATDQDCKVTALLMLKELRQHYSNIHRIRVFFYDPANIRSYREVSVQQSDVAQVDMGKSLQSVLSQVAVRRVSAPVTAAGGSSSYSRQRGAIRTQEYTNFTSQDGDLSMQCPAGWTPQPTNIYLVKLYTARGPSSATVTLLRQHFEFAGPSIEDLVNKQETALLARGPGVKIKAKRSESCGGTPGIYLEASTHIGNTEGVERMLILRNPKAYFLLSMTSVGMDEREMGAVFSKMSSSLRIRG